MGRKWSKDKNISNGLAHRERRIRENSRKEGKGRTERRSRTK